MYKLSSLSNLKWKISTHKKIVLVEHTKLCSLYSNHNMPKCAISFFVTKAYCLSRY